VSSDREVEVLYNKFREVFMANLDSFYPSHIYPDSRIRAMHDPVFRHQVEHLTSCITHLCQAAKEDSRLTDYPYCKTDDYYNHVKEIASLKNYNSVHSKINDGLNNEIDQLKAEYKALEDTNEILRKGMGIKQNSREHLKAELSKANKAISVLTTQEEQHVQEIVALKNPLKAIVDDYFDWADGFDIESDNDLRIHALMIDCLNAINPPSTEDK
jgi:hypothetical protein